MVYILMESSILLRSIHAHVTMDKKKVMLVGTNGFIYNYRRSPNGAVEVTLKNKDIYDKLVNYQQKLEENDEVIIATDHDQAGELIALELLSIFPNAKRYKNRVDDLLYEPELVVDAVVRNSGNQYFCKEMAMSYLEEKLSGASNRSARMKILEYVLAHDNNETIIVPPRYGEIIKAL